METGSTVQMNTRIDRGLKETGDRVFAHIGCSPSRAVRAMWRFAAARSASPQEVEQFVSEAESAKEVQESVSSVVQERLAALEAGWRLCEGHNMPISAEVANVAYRDLRDEAYLERFGEGIA